MTEIEALQAIADGISSIVTAAWFMYFQLVLLALMAALR